MTANSFLMYYLIISRPIGYILVFIGMIIEGDILLFTAAFLTHQGIFDIGDMLIAVLAGAIIGDALWYLLGLKLNNSSLFLTRWMDRIARPFDKQLANRPFHTIFISKFIYGIHHALLIRAGNLKLSFREFVLVDFLAIVLWIAVVGGFGYISGASFALSKQYLRFVEFGLAAGLIVFFILLHIIKVYFEKRS